MLKLRHEQIGDIVFRHGRCGVRVVIRPAPIVGIGIRPQDCILADDDGKGAGFIFVIVCRDSVRYSIAAHIAQRTALPGHAKRIGERFARADARLKIQFLTRKGGQRRFVYQQFIYAARVIDRV